METNAFLEFVGDTPVNRLLDFLMTGRDFDYTLTELAAKSEMSWSTLHRIFPRFIENEIVIQTREIGRAKLYKLNINNKIVQKYLQIYDAILMQELERIEEKPLLA